MKKMRIGIEQNLPAEFFVSGAAGADSDFDIVTLEGRTGIEMVRAGDLEIALVPALSVIADPGDIEVVPAVAMSSWRYPFAQLYLPGGLDSKPDRILFDGRFREEANLTRIILKEHYHLTPSFEAVGSLDDFKDDTPPSIRVGNDVSVDRSRGLYLDIGQEWYELANYPMVWGLFVMAKGSVTPEVVRHLREVASRTEKLRTRWADAADRGGAIRRFFLEDVRVRFDDLVTASLTQLLDYAFYYDLADEIRAFPVASVEISESDDGPTPIL
ncbi:MAG: hypothetical protein KJO98_06110 [Rhodothermia bacterium]|nr:hypothetical protein [Rhodothermia bacterium]